MLSTIYEYIPESKRIPVQTAILQTISEPINEVKLLAGGLSEASTFLISTELRKYTLKLLPDAIDKNGLMAKYKLAVAAGIAPGYYYLDDTIGLYITDYIQNQPINTVFSAAQTVTALGACISALHKMTPPAMEKEADLKGIYEHAISWLVEKGFLQGTDKDSLLARFEDIKAVYPWNDGGVFCHYDLNPRNVLCDGERLWIIDWDTSAVSDRFVDLGVAAMSFAPSDELEKLLLQAYFNDAPTAEQVARFKIIKQLCRLVYSTMFFQLVMRNTSVDMEYNLDPHETDLPTVGMQLRSGALSLGTPKGLWLYGKAMLNEGLRQMTDPGFMEYLTCLKP